MADETFDARQKRLIEDWEREATSAETEDQIGHAIVDLFLKSERIRRGVEMPSHEQALVDQETIKKLRDPRVLGPEFSLAEAAFRRLVDDPAFSVKYLQEALDNRRKAQSRIAKNLRPQRYDPFTKMINVLVEKKPDISAKAVGQLLREHSGIDFDPKTGVFTDGERYTLNERNLPSRLSAAKKRVSG